DIVAVPHDNNAPANQAAKPDVLYESLMLGTPVLVGEGAEEAELVRREELGYVVNHNHPQELKDVLKSLGDTRKHDQMRRRCRRYFLQNLTLADELEKYGRFYRRLIDRQPIPNGNQRT
ncbi:MAG: glycosyltransferase, partial [Phycisphaerae bacterium]|nr:glycosyltransferase [Phycisphaerae bacterium]